MSDLNEWVLDYTGTSFSFGTLASDYPLRVQVDVSDVARRTQDADHPNSDGRLFGRDLLGGFSLTFDGVILPEYPLTGYPWRTSMDMYSAFAAAWRADVIRKTPGAYATLTNLDRNKLVYGRPRKIAEKLTRARKGEVGFLATFETNGPDVYSAEERIAVINPVPPAAGGVSSPIEAPWSTQTNADETSPLINEGDTETWPIIQMRGPGAGHSISLLDGSTKLWTLSVPDGLKADEIITIDTRPWHRSVLVNGRPGMGRIRGTQLEKCMIPVGEFDAVFKVNDRTGVADAALRWRDAFASI